MKSITASPPSNLDNINVVLAVYETRCEKEYGYFRPIVKDVLEKIPLGLPEVTDARQWLAGLTGM